MKNLNYPNILIDDQFHPKIADFGLSHSVNDSNNIADEFTTSKSVNIKGTPNYIAPEIWNEQGYTEATDMYSFGVLLYELVFLRKAFRGLKPIQVALKVNKDERPPFPVLTKQNAFKALIQRCWAQDPDKRPTFKQLMVELKDKKYISKDIDQKEYQEYIKYLQDFK